MLRKGYDLYQYFHPAEEAFGPFVEQGLESLRQTQSGFVYLAVDPTMTPGVHKIGLTRKTPQERMRTLGSSGTLGTYHLVKAWHTIEVAVSEANCKRALVHRRVAGEFYFGHYAEITEVMNRVLLKEAQALHDLRALLTI